MRTIKKVIKCLLVHITKCSISRNPHKLCTTVNQRERLVNSNIIHFKITWMKSKNACDYVKNHLEHKWTHFKLRWLMTINKNCIQWPTNSSPATYGDLSSSVWYHKILNIPKNHTCALWFYQYCQLCSMNSKSISRCTSQNHAMTNCKPCSSPRACLLPGHPTTWHPWQISIRLHGTVSGQHDRQCDILVLNNRS